MVRCRKLAYAHTDGQSENIKASPSVLGGGIRYCGILTGTVPVHLYTSPAMDRPKEEEFTQLLTNAGRIIGHIKTPEYTSLLKRLSQNLSSQEKDEVRDGLKETMSTALSAGGIPGNMIRTFALVFVNMVMDGIELYDAEPGDSIVLYFKCLSLDMLLRLRDMILSGLLLRIFSEPIKQFIQSRSQVQLVVRAEDFKRLFYSLRTAAGRSTFFVLGYCFTASWYYVQY